MSKDLPDMCARNQGHEAVSIEIDHKPIEQNVRHYLNMYMDDIWVGWMVIKTDGSIEIEMKDKEKTMVREKLVPMVAAFPSMVESISCDIDLRSPLEM